MIVWAQGTVTAVTGGWSGAVELLVRRADTGTDCRALLYPALMAVPAPGEAVLLNVSALERGLGTGGYALVVAATDDRGAPLGQPEPPQGHLVKARYTPLQAMVAGADEQGSPYHAELAGADDLGGLVVLTADLHSALAPALAAVHHDRPGTRVVYLMSDHGALPIAFSRSVAQLRERGWLAATVTAGQAYGGDLESVNVHSGLLAARIALGADLVILTQGPGNLGTGTRWGFSGVACGEAVNAVSTLGGRAVGALRISGADQRSRHRGISHHSLTAYGRVALRPADLALPYLAGASTLRGIDGLEAVAALAPEVEQVAEAALTADVPGHRLVGVALDGLDQALLRCPVPLSTMGRGLHQDPAYFLASAAAGRLAARLI